MTQETTTVAYETPTSTTVRPATTRVGAAGRRIPLRTYAILVTLGVVGTIGAIPYMEELLGSAIAEAGLSRIAFAVTAIVQGIVMATLLALVGLRLESRTGLGAPLLERLTGDRAATDRPVDESDVPAPTGDSSWRTVGTSAAIGAVVGAVVLTADVTIFSGVLEGSAIEVPVWWKAIPASIYGGVMEEIILRLFLVNVVVSLLMAIGKTPTRQPTVLQLAVALTLAAVFFGALHVVTATIAGPVTALFAFRTVLLNAVAGLTFGVIFVRRGLLAAMVAHLCADLAMHVVGIPIVAAIVGGA